MKKAVKILSAVLAVCILLCGCEKAAPEPENKIVVTTSLEGKPVLVGDIPCSFPLTEENAKLNILITQYGNMRQEDVYVWQKYREMTGVDVSWNEVGKNERAEAVSTALVNKQDIDLIMRCKVSASRLAQYGKEGLVLDLAEGGLLEKYAPNCWAYLTSHPEALASVTTPDGKIYSIPQINSGAELRVASKIFVNKNWLERVGMDLPSTTEEFYEMLRAFKEQDANGNGDKNDEIPYCCADTESIEYTFFGAFGLGNRGIHNAGIDCDPKTGKVRYMKASESCREFLEYVKKLYSEELLDNSVFTMTTEKWKINAKSDMIGAFISTNLAWIPAGETDNWVAIGEALEGPNGDKLWMPVRANFHSVGAALIPSTCKNPELVLRWLDYFWTDEGTLFYHMGVEGETFVADENGNYDYAPAIYEEMEAKNMIFDDVVAEYLPYPGGSNPTVEIAPYFMGGEMADVPAEAARSLFKYGPKEYWPSFTLTEEENEVLNSVKSDIEKYNDSMFMEFVTGKTPLSEWDKYIEQLDKLGLQKLLGVYQAAADRYENNK